jgi:hypothetical protein
MQTSLCDAAVAKNHRCVATPRVGIEIPSIFIFHEMVPNKIMKFRVFYLLQNVSERNSKLFFIFRELVRNGIPSFFYLPRIGSERNSKHFPFVELTEFRRNESKFRRNFFSRKIATLAPPQRIVMHNENPEAMRRGKV